MKYNTIINSSRRNLGGTRHLGKLAILRTTLRKTSFSRFPRKYQVCDIATLISKITISENDNEDILELIFTKSGISKSLWLINQLKTYVSN